MQNSYAQAQIDGLRVVDGGLGPAKKCKDRPDRPGLTPLLGIVEARRALPLPRYTCSNSLLHDHLLSTSTVLLISDLHYPLPSCAQLPARPFISTPTHLVRCPLRSPPLPRHSAFFGLTHVIIPYSLPARVVHYELQKGYSTISKA